MIEIGAQLKAYFKDKGLTQEMIANHLGVSQSYINALFNDKQHFGKGQAIKWSKKYGLSSNWLLTGEGPMLNLPKNSFSQMTEREIGDTASSAITEVLMRLYKAGEIYPAEVHDKMMAEKNEEIAKRDRRIEELQKEIWELRKELEK